MMLTPRIWIALGALCWATAFVGCGGDAFTAGGAGGAGGAGAATSITATSTSTCAGADCASVTSTATTTSTTTSGQGGAGGEGGGHGEGGGPPASPGMALLFSQLPGTSGSSAVSTGSSDSSGITATSGGGADPNTLLIFLGEPLDCGNPGGVDCGDQWSFSMHLPPGLQAVGTYTLEEVNATMSETVGPAGACTFGSGAFWDGVVEISDISDTKVLGTVFTNSAGGWAHDPGGPFVAPRCF